MRQVFYKTKHKSVIAHCSPFELRHGEMCVTFSETQWKVNGKLHENMNTEMERKIDR